MSGECGRSGYFLQITPPPSKEERLFKEIGSQIHSAPHREKSPETARRIHSNMASIPSSSFRSDSEKGEWERCLVSHSQLAKLQTQGFLPPADLVPVRAGLASFNGKTKAEDFPNPSAGERLCFVPYLLRGVGFPIHPFL